MDRFRFAGVAAVLVLWMTLLTAAALSGFDLLGPDPLSYMGTGGRSAALFTIGLAVSALLLVGFHQYVRSRYEVGIGFSLAMVGGLAGQMVAAFVDIGGHSTAHRIHTNSALILGISLPLLMWRFAAGQPEGPWRRLSYRLFWAEAAACVIGFFLSARGIAPVAEIIPAVAFHAWVITVTFSTFGARPRTPTPTQLAVVAVPLAGPVAAARPSGGWPPGSSYMTLGTWGQPTNWE